MQQYLRCNAKLICNGNEVLDEEEIDKYGKYVMKPTYSCYKGGSFIITITRGTIEEVVKILNEKKR